MLKIKLGAGIKCGIIKKSQTKNRITTQIVTWIETRITAWIKARQADRIKGLFNRHKKTITSTATVLLLAILQLPSAHAALVDRGVFLRDTDTGTEYLKLEHTLGLSYDQATAPGAVFAGEGDWVLASSAQINALTLSDRVALTGVDALPQHASYGVFLGEPDDGHLRPNNEVVYWLVLAGNPLLDSGTLVLTDVVSRSFQDDAFGALLARPVLLPAAGGLFLAAMGLLTGRRLFSGDRFMAWRMA